MWARPALLALLLTTALLYLVGLSRNGWANEFYAGAAQAGTESWKAFLFGSLDSANFITVDKPAGFLWPMELSARIFGVNYWSLLVPQALAGVATVGVLYAAVRRWFGPAAAVIAGTVMALTPVATLIFRFNDPDAFITLMATLAAYAGIRALESGRTRWVALTGVLFGLGFLGKMLAGFLALPALALAYLVCGPPGLGKRIWQLLVGGAALLASAGWWVAIVLLTPAADRPFVGSTTDNNILQLTFGYNGLSRLTGNRGGGFGGAARAAGRGLGAGGFGGGAGGAGGPAGPGPGAGAAARAFGGGAGGPFGGGTGITRMFTAEWGGQISWLIPAALIAIVLMLWVSCRAARTDRTRAAAILWGGWLVVAGLVLSFMSGTTHSYYAVALAPPIGALIGIGAVTAWRARHTWFARAAMAAALAVTAAWAWVLLGRNPGWYPWLSVVIVIAAVGAAGLILAGPALRASTARGAVALAAVPVSLAVIAGLGGPLAYSLDTAATTYAGTSPSAGPPMTAALGGPGGARGLGRGFVPGRGGGFAGGPPATGRAASRAASAVSAASGVAETPPSAAPSPSCWRAGLPATPGPRPPTARTAQPRWNWPPVASRSWRSAVSGAPTPRGASPSSKSSSPSARSTTTWLAAGSAAAASAARAAVSAVAWPTAGLAAPAAPAVASAARAASVGLAALAAAPPTRRRSARGSRPTSRRGPWVA